MRKLHRVYRADSRHWVGDGFHVQTLFSHMDEDRGSNPFLMLDYAAPHYFDPGDIRRPRGVGRIRIKVLKPLPSPTKAKSRTATQAEAAA